MERRNTCDDRELIAEYDAVIEELSAADHTRASLAEEMDKRESWMRQGKEKAKATPFKNEANRYAEQAETHEAILADLRAKFEPADNNGQRIAKSPIGHRRPSALTVIASPLANSDL